MTAVSAVRAVQAELHGVSTAYFAAMGIPLVSGRFFVAQDTTTSRTAVVLSESAERQLFGKQTAVGKEVAFDQSGAKRMDVVGGDLYSVTAVGLVATFVPARRILQIDAAASLRA